MRSGDATSFHPNIPLKAGDISQASKDSLSVSHDLHNVKPQSRFKRSVIRPQPRDSSVVTESDTKSNLINLAGVKHNRWGEVYPDGFNPGLSYDSWLSQEGHGNLRQENERISSIMTLEAAFPVIVAKHQPVLWSRSQIDDNDDCLNLTLGLPPARALYALRK